MISRPRGKKGFSLAETAIALGLVAFCLVALLGLIPSGLQAIQDTQRRSEAVRLLKLMATGLQAARRVPASTQWQMLGLTPDSQIRWSPDGVPLGPIRGWAKVSGMPVAQAQPGDFAYVINLTPQDESQPSSYARAMLRIAWPATAVWTEGRWMQAQGSEEVLVLFRLR